VRSALAGERPLHGDLRERIRRYRKQPGSVRVLLDLEASEVATVVEVHAGAEVGLLAQLAATFADLDVDVTVAKVATLGDRVVDVFYVRDGAGRKITDRLTLDRLKATLVARLTSDYALP
jgi:[protein-PII] uridylyltransferase